MSNRLRGRFPNRTVSNRLPSWVLTAGGVAASLDIDFVNDQAYNSGSTSIASLLSCTRASSGYYTNADGTLTQFSDHQLRYGTNGALVEEARTNLILRSEEIDNVAWSNAAGQSTTTPDAAVAPNGLTVAERLLLGSGSGEHIRFQSFTATAAAYTQSVYAKKGTANWLGLSFLNRATVDGAFFDLQNGVVGTVQAGTTAAIQALANGWYRCSITRTLTAATHYCILEVHTADNQSTTFSAAGTETLFVFGAQVELGSFPTSYIPTTGSSATRNADLVTFASTSFFNGATDTVYASWIARNVNNAKVWALDAANDVLLDEQTGMSARISDAGGSFAITVGNTAAAAATVKAAAAIASNDAAICMNGGTVGTDATVTVAGALSASRLGCDLSGSNYLNGYITRVAYWPSRISNANLQTLTA